MFIYSLDDVLVPAHIHPTGEEGGQFSHICLLISLCMSLVFASSLDGVLLLFSAIAFITAYVL